MANQHEHSDSALLAKFRRGDDDAATELYLKYAQRLRDVAKTNTSVQLKSRFDEEDVVQSVFRTFFRRASEGYFDVPPGDEIWNLFLVITLNKIRRLGKFHRRQKRDVGATEHAVESDLQRFDATPLVALQMSIDELLKSLAPEKRKIVEMRIQGFDVTEISSAVQRCTRTVERTIRQFRETLARQIHDDA